MASDSQGQLAREILDSAFLASKKRRRDARERGGTADKIMMAPLLDDRDLGE
jgi:hypothetical protein